MEPEPEPPPVDRDEARALRRALARQQRRGWLVLGTVTAVGCAGALAAGASGPVVLVVAAGWVILVAAGFVRRSGYPEDARPGARVDEHGVVVDQPGSEVTYPFVMIDEARRDGLLVRLDLAVLRAPVFVLGSLLGDHDLTAIRERSGPQDVSRLPPDGRRELRLESSPAPALAGAIRRRSVVTLGGILVVVLLAELALTDRAAIAWGLTAAVAVVLLLGALLVRRPTRGTTVRAFERQYPVGSVIRVGILGDDLAIDTPTSRQRIALASVLRGSGRDVRLLRVRLGSRVGLVPVLAAWLDPEVDARLRSAGTRPASRDV